MLDHVVFFHGDMYTDFNCQTFVHTLSGNATASEPSQTIVYVPRRIPSPGNVGYPYGQIIAEIVRNLAADLGFGPALTDFDDDGEVDSPNIYDNSSLTTSSATGAYPNVIDNPAAFNAAIRHREGWIPAEALLVHPEDCTNETVTVQSLNKIPDGVIGPSAVLVSRSVKQTNTHPSEFCPQLSPGQPWANRPNGTTLVCCLSGLPVLSCVGSD